MAKRRKKSTIPKVNRFDKARNLVSLDAVKSLRTDKSGRIINALVPGSEAKTYEVIARREGRNYIEVECFLQTGAGPKECKGGWSTVCYHALAVLLTSAQNNNHTTAVCLSEYDANKRKNIGGKVFTVRSKHAHDNPLWIVANPIQPTENNQPDQKSKQKSEEQLLMELGY